MDGNEKMNGNQNDPPKFHITHNHKSKSEFKIEPRILDFDQMNRNIGLDLKKPSENKPNTLPPPRSKTEKSSSDFFTDPNQELFIDDLRSRLKAFQERDSKKDLSELESFGFNEKDILPGEFISERFDAETLIGGSRCNALILLTNFRILILPINEKFLRCLKLRKEYIEIPYMCVESLKRNLDRKSSPPLALFEILTKDFLEIKLKFIMEEELTLKTQDKIFAYLQTSINPSFVELYALQISKSLKKLDQEFKGWELLSIEREFNRQGLRIYDNDLDLKDFQYKYVDNSEGKICSTYPEKLVVPFRIAKDFILRSASFRSRERLPVLTFGYTIAKTSKKVGLWRCSQCKPGISSSRCVEDESLVRAIGEDIQGQVGSVKIFDARPYMNAVANKMNGKGFEDVSSYRNAEITFLEIPNIHKVREAYRKVKEPGEAGSTEKPDLTAWMDCLSRILKGAAEMVQSLKEGITVLLHCSDGWDRTSQLSSLTQIALDPYFRTLEGFFVLVEKEWVSFGHQFATRCGHAKNSSDDQKAPIFVQFLDCVHQIYHQYPLSFEFTPLLLNDIAYYLNTCYFGNFLMDTIIDRDKKCRFQETTVSLWSFLLSRRENYLNPFYKTPKELDQTETIPFSSLKLLRLWKEHFLRNSTESEDHYRIYEGTQFPEDNVSIEFQNIKRENIVLKKTTKEMLVEVTKLREELKHYQEKIGKI